MPQIKISDAVYERVMAFKPVVEEVLEVSLETDNYIELLLRLAPDFLLQEFLGGAEAKSLLALLQRIGQFNPQVFTALAQAFQQDEVKTIEAQRRSEVKQTLGFPEPQT